MIRKLNNTFRKDIEKLIIKKIKKVTKKDFDSLLNLQEQIGDEWFSLDEANQTKIGSELYFLDEENKTYHKLLNDISEQLDMDFYFQKTVTIRAHPYYHNSTYWYHLDTNTFNQHPEQFNVFIPITTEDVGFSLVPAWFTKLSLILTNNDIKKLDKRKFLTNYKWWRNICRWVGNDYNNLEDILVWDSDKHLHTALPRNNTNRFSLDFRLLPIDHDTNHNYESISPHQRRVVKYKPGSFFSSKTIRETINN